MNHDSFKVFISSTYTDMVKYRGAIERAISRAECVAVGMESWAASAIPPLDECLEKLCRCNIYICVLGMRYGSVDTESGKSYTELEYEKARELGIPRLVFLVDEEKVSFLAKEVDRGSAADKLDSFKKSIKDSKEVTCCFFASESELEGLAFQSIQNEIKRSSFIPAPSIEAVPDFISGANLYRKFVRRPLRYKNQECILRVRMDGNFGGWRTRDEVYNAFGFIPGDALFLNDIWVLGYTKRVDVDDDLWRVDCFADGKAADWLDDSEVTTGVVFEGKFRFMYEVVTNGVGSRGGEIHDGYIACLALIEGIQVIDQLQTTAVRDSNNVFSLQ